MALTKKELHLLRAINLAVIKSKMDSPKLAKERVIARARFLETVYKNSPRRLCLTIKFYSDFLTDKEMNETYEEILEIFAEMRADVLNV